MVGRCLGLYADHWIPYPLYYLQEEKMKGLLISPSGFEVTYHPEPLADYEPTTKIKLVYHEYDKSFTLMQLWKCRFAEKGLPDEWYPVKAESKLGD